MTDTSAIEDRIAKGERFRLFMEREGINDSFAAIRQQFLEAMLKCGATDDLKRYRAQVAVRVFDEVRAIFDDAIADGRIADSDMKRIVAGKRSFF